MSCTYDRMVRVKQGFGYLKKLRDGRFQEEVSNGISGISGEKRINLVMLYKQKVLKKK